MKGCSFGGELVAGGALQHDAAAVLGIESGLQGGQLVRRAALLRAVVSRSARSHQGPASARRIGLRVAGSQATVTRAAAAWVAGQPRLITARCRAAARQLSVQRTVGCRRSHQGLLAAPGPGRPGRRRPQASRSSRLPRELLHRPVDRVDRSLLQSAGEQRPAGHARAGGVPVAEEDGIEADGAIADVGVEQQLRDGREPLRLDGERVGVAQTVDRGAVSGTGERRRGGSRLQRWVSVQSSATTNRLAEPLPVHPAAPRRAARAGMRLGKVPAAGGHSRTRRHDAADETAGRGTCRHRVARPGHVRFWLFIRGFRVRSPGGPPSGTAA